MNDLIKENYHLEMSRSKSFGIKAVLVNDETKAKVLLLDSEINKLCKSSIIKESLRNNNKLVVNYDIDSFNFLAVIKREDGKTLAADLADSYDAAIDRLSDYLVWICPDYAAIYDDIDRKLDAAYGMIFSADINGYYKEAEKKKIIPMKKKEYSFFLMFSGINSALRNDRDMFLTVTKEEDRYRISLNDTNNEENNAVITSDDLVDGLVIVNKKIKTEKGKVYAKNIISNGSRNGK